MGVRHLGHLLGHPVDVRSRLGHGTVFSVSVPVGRVRATAANVPAADGLALIVDDETGVKVIRGVHGACALAIPAVVLTGHTGPERLAEGRRSGFHLIAQAGGRRHPPHLLNDIKTRRSA